MIDVEEVTKDFNGFRAVDKVSFSVAAGETLILFGTSGCGKTTTLKMINRLEEPSSGRISINGQNIKEQNKEELRRGVGYVIQHIGLFPHYSVAQNIAIVPQLLKWDKKRITNRTYELLELVGLPPAEYLDRFPGELSGGQQQRVGLARALAADPPVVLLDEPFGALDLITRRQIQEEFKNLDTILDKTMIIVTHDVFEAFALGDRICVMDQGRIQQAGTPREILFSPANEFVENFLQVDRFQLELTVLCLEDILPDLAMSQKTKIVPNSTASAENANIVNTFENTVTLAQVLATVEHKTVEDSSFRVLDKDNNRWLETNTGELLTAFYQARARGLK